VARDESKERVGDTDTLSDRNEGEVQNNEEGWLKEEGEWTQGCVRESERKLRPGEVQYCTMEAMAPGGGGIWWLLAFGGRAGPCTSSGPATYSTVQ
jgi:hypothetical protein